MEGLKEGRIVYFVASEYDAEQLHNVGNPIHAGDIVAAMVTKVWSNNGCINVKLIGLDGPESPWITSVTYDANKGPRTWHWMYEGQATRGQVSGEVVQPK